jgi:FlaG/FlaF family flagellin (archaellin)
VPALLKVDKGALDKAVRRVKLVLDEGYPYVELHISKNEVVVRGTQKSGAEAATSVKASWATKPRIATFNIAHLSRTLSSLPDGELELRFGNDTKTKKSPMVMEGVGSWMMLNQSNLGKRA